MMGNKLAKLGAGAGIFGVVSALMTVAAYATAPVDPTGGAYGSGVDSTKSFITDTAAGPLFALAAVVVGIMVGLRWLKRSKTAAS